MRIKNWFGAAVCATLLVSAVQSVQAGDSGVKPLKQARAAAAKQIVKPVSSALITRAIKPYLVKPYLIAQIDWRFYRYRGRPILREISSLLSYSGVLP